jgi:hypothetical protein
VGKHSFNRVPGTRYTVVIAGYDANENFRYLGRSARQYVTLRAALRAAKKTLGKRRAVLVQAGGLMPGQETTGVVNDQGTLVVEPLAVTSQTLVNEAAVMARYARKRGKRWATYHVWGLDGRGKTYFQHGFQDEEST